MKIYKNYKILSNNYLLFNFLKEYDFHYLNYLNLKDICLIHGICQKSMYLKRELKYPCSKRGDTLSNL